MAHHYFKKIKADKIYASNAQHKYWLFEHRKGDRDLLQGHTWLL